MSLVNGQKKPSGKDYYVQKAINDNLIKIDAVEVDDKGNAKLDKAGKPVYKDFISWTGNNAQIHAVWTAIKELLEARGVLPDDVEATLYLMEMIAKQERPAHNGDFPCELPVNYMVALCHVLGAALQITTIKNDKKYSESLEILREFFAVEVEGYRRKKREESAMDLAPEEISGKELTVNDGKYF